MADRGDTHYHVPNLNNWFLFSSFLLLLTVFWTVIDDWNAEWKGYQREFRALELEMAENALSEFEAQGMLDSAAELEASVAAAEQLLTDSGDELETARREEYEAKEIRYRIEEQFKTAKANMNWDKYMEEGAILDGETDPATAIAELEDPVALTNALELEFQDATDVWNEKKQRTTELTAARDATVKTLAAETRELQRVRQKIELLDPSDSAVRIANVVRDFPGLDFIGPNLKVTKQVLENLTFELNFTKKTRIDMCTTCHMGVESADFTGEDVEEPFRSHPRLDLFLTSKSPHPLKEVGCTICHRGSGESLSFQHADHRPSTEEQAEEWEALFHWHKQHHWDYPMLKAQHVEAGCIQCHTTTMDLIADEAPKMTEGYQTFERYGCYACHKVEWFPTKRRPGPTLKNLQAKVDFDFVNSWIAHPKDFRPTTWMPQVFHLENLPEDEIVTTSNYGLGEPITGGEWNNSAVAAISTFLFENHPKQEMPPIPVEGDVDRGRERFKTVACTACHNMAPYEVDGSPFMGIELPEGVTAGDVDSAYVADRYNTAGPNLRGVATKINARWLFNWLKDPAAYWSETNMPNLRLSDQDASDITAYMMEDPDGIFTDVPEGWEPEASPATRVALEEQARWFYQKLGRREIERRLDGENPEHRWDDPQQLKVAVGEVFVRNHGCYSCHEVAGMENDMPIGTELTSWGSKTVDKLDFGMSYLKEVGGRPKLEHEYKEGWLERKLHHPRSFDLDKIKNPKEKLRMPWFDFTDDQVDALVTFVSGLVIDEVKLARMNPTPEQAAKDQGMRVVRQKNCVACHMVDPGTITYTHESGEVVTVQAELYPLPDETLPPPMVDLEDLQESLDGWAEYWEEDPLEAIDVRLLATHGDVGLSSANVSIPIESIVSVTPPSGGDFVRQIVEYYFYGTNVPDPEAAEDEDPWYGVTVGYDEETEENLIEDSDGVQRAYAESEYDKLRWTFAPPVLWNEGHKLQREWFYSFLKDPVTLREQIRVRMPSFTYGAGEAEAVADYFANKSRDEWYARYSHTMRQMLGRELRDDIGDTAWPLELQKTWPAGAFMTTGDGMSITDVAVSAEISDTAIRAIEHGSKPDIAAKFAGLFKWGTEQGFHMTGQVSGSYETIERRTPTHFEQARANLDIGQLVARDGVNCYQCHPTIWERVDPTTSELVAEHTFPETPIAWAPDLRNARERLREEWVREWLWSPKFVYPGTAMPDNFSSDEPQYQAQFPDSTNGQQIHAVMDWVFNLDRSTPISD